MAGDPKPVFAVEDDFCNWIEVFQGAVQSCPPKEGSAVMTFKTLLVQGWIPEVRGVWQLGHLFRFTERSAGKIRHRYQSHLKERDSLTYLVGFASCRPPCKVFLVDKWMYIGQRNV